MTDFARERSTADQVLAHLQDCDASFVPPLSSRVDVPAYADKLARHAVRFEAWDGATLAALVAVYANDVERRVAFVTSVSVLPAYRGQALAQRLMAQCLEHAGALGFERVELEVGSENTAAQALYRKLGFQIKQADGPSTVMWRAP